jgi:ribosomal-protein-alanine N-acetyltransferase
MWAKMVRGVKSALRLGADPDGDELAGYVGIWLQGDQAHITEIAVRESLRGQGIGELLVIGTVRIAYEQGLEEVTLEARVSNFIAQRLYDKYGFNEMGIRKNYYADNREDAVIMTTDHIHTQAYRTKFQELERRFSERYGCANMEL